ncbi:MAG: nucleotidyltransferase domain-containing protein [Pseudomonadota bacterium]|jgi:predicted nucleotidyltransferase
MQPATEADFGLPAATLEAIRSILAEAPAVQRAIIFGSRAMGNYRRGSDIDLALQGPDVTLDVQTRLSARLDESPIPYQVDLVRLDALEHPGLRAHIERVGQVFYERAFRSLEMTATR